MKDQIWTIQDVARYLNKFPETNNDCFVGVAGFEGTGKSVFSRLEARELNLMRGQRMDLQKTMFFGRGALKEALTDTFKGIYIDDEAIREYSRTFFGKKQIEYIKMTKVIRFHLHIVFKNIPVLWELDSSLRRRLAVYIYIVRKPINGKSGLAYLFQRESGAFIPDAWNVKLNEKLERRGMITRSPNFYGYIKIPDLSDKSWFVHMEEEAFKIKEAKKSEAYSEDEKIDCTELAKVLVSLQELDCLKYDVIRSIATKFGYSYGHLKNLMSDVRGKNNKS